MNEPCINNLPYDIIELFQSKLNSKSWRSLELDNIIKLKKKRKLISLLKIQLFFKIFIYYSKLKYYIIKSLKITFNLPYYFGNQINYNQEYFYPNKLKNYIKYQSCVYYAPHMPNGTCRTCGNLENQHQFSKDFIEKYYIPKINILN